MMFIPAIPYIVAAGKGALVAGATYGTYQIYKGIQFLADAIPAFLKHGLAGSLPVARMVLRRE